MLDSHSRPAHAWNDGIYLGFESNQVTADVRNVALGYNWGIIISNIIMKVFFPFHAVLRRWRKNALIRIRNRLDFGNGV